MRVLLRRTVEQLQQRRCCLTERIGAKVYRCTCHRRFAESGTLLDPGESKRKDKHSVVADANRTVTHLRTEQQRLRSLIAGLEVGSNCEFSSVMELTLGAR